MNLPAPENAILIRVAVDQAYGKWNGPCNRDTGDFVYVPIPQDKPNAPGMATEYLPIIGPALQAFSARNAADITLPAQLRGRRMHLDPDFDYLTYGDTADRGRRLLGFKPNDLLVFYSGLRPIQGGSGLVYGLIGMLVVDSVRHVVDIPATEHACNAHTRLLHRTNTDIVVTGKPAFSGRFAKYIDIGEFRNRAYRVRQELLDAWGGLSVNDGWIQRSANPPLFQDPARFTQWLASEKPILFSANNLMDDPFQTRPARLVLARAD